MNITCNLDPSTAQEIKRRAEKLGLSPSQFCKRLILDFVNDVTTLSEIEAQINDMREEMKHEFFEIKKALDY